MSSLITRLLEMFAVVLLGLVATGCATTPALHVIGVYEGTLGTDDSAWRAKCSEGEEDSQPRAGLIVPTIDCQRRYSGQPAEKEIVLNISDDTRPIVLALTAYDRTLWKVSLKQGVKITKVILGGYHSQRVSGIHSETPIETYTYDPSPCETCWQGGQYFYSYQSPPAELKQITGLEVTSFQGRYRGTEFHIFTGIKKIEYLP